MMMRWRMIVRRIAFEGASNLVVGSIGRVARDNEYCTFCDVRGL